MTVETINLGNKVIYQASWKGEKARAKSPEEAEEILLAFLRLKERFNLA